MPMMILGVTTGALPEPPNMTTESQARIDEEIAVFTLSICNLRTRRNTFSLISRLPPEILAAIFVHCARSYHENLYRSYGIPPWVNLSYICRHWREVALNCPTLWSYMFASSRRWTDELLARSKMAPLKISMDILYPKQSKELDFLEKVAAHANRIQDLRLKLTRREAERILPKFTSRAPHLQTLQISVERGSYGFLGEPAPSTIVMFDGDAPALRKLELSNYSFPWGSPAFNGLTTLRLRDLSMTLQPSLEGIKAVLGRMPHLTYLYLENALPSAGIHVCPTNDDSRKISLSRLARFSIIAPFSTVILLLSSLDIPLKAEVRIRCSLDNSPNTNDMDNHTPIFPLLARRFSQPGDQTHSPAPIIRTTVVAIAAMTIGFIFSSSERDCDRHSYSSSMSSYEVNDLREDWDCNIPLKVDIVLRTYKIKDREELIGALCPSLPLTDLSSLHLIQDMGTHLSMAFWKDTFGALQELKYIKVSNGTSKDLISVLFPICPHSKDRSTDPIDKRQIFAPGLQEIEFTFVEFSEDCFDADYCTGMVGCLQEALVHRKGAGYALNKLTFTECMYVFDEDVALLGEGGVGVDWDGITKTASDYEEDEEDEEEEHDDYYYDDSDDPYGWGYLGDYL